MLPDNKPGDFGRYLQACRMAGGHSLDDIARQTKITRKCLQQIENEDLKHLPQPAFTRGFIRAFAQVVGADGDDALARYEQRCGMALHFEQEVGRAASGTAGFWGRLALALLLFAGTVAVTVYMAQTYLMSGPE